MRPVVLSMTTIPSRSGVIRQAIESLRRQTQHFDDLRIYVTPDIKHLATDHSIAFCYADDRGPVTKISAVCDPEVPDDAIVVTVDDDIAYRPKWLETLLHAVEQHPDEALGFSGWNTAWFLDDPIAGHFEHAAVGQTCDVLEGFAGVAYRKSWFGPEVLQPPSFARSVDDVWISSLLHRKGIQRRVIAPPMLTVLDHGGLHAAPDFIAKNRLAANRLFAP